jgi:hypothetical protein
LAITGLAENVWYTSFVQSKGAVEPTSPPPNFYAKGAMWAHGGPAELEGGQLRRYAKHTADHGGIFLVRDGGDSLKYAAIYARGGLYKVQCSLGEDEVFDLSNPEHVERTRPVDLPDAKGCDFLRTAFESQRMGALDWSAIDEEVLVTAGFKGALLAERPAGVIAPSAIFSLVAFDARSLAVVGSYSQPEIASLQRSVMAYTEMIQAQEQRRVDSERATRSAREVTGVTRGGLRQPGA